MAFTQAQLDQLDAMIASNTLEVTTSDGKRVKFDSLDSLLRRRRLVAAALGGSSAGRRQVSYVTIRSDEV